MDNTTNRIDRIDLCDGNVIHGIANAAEFTHKVATYALYLNVDVSRHNGRYCVWAEELNPNKKYAFVTPSAPTSNTSNPTMGICEGTICIATQTQCDGYKMSASEVLSKVLDAVQSVTESLTCFTDKLIESGLLTEDMTP